MTSKANKCYQQGFRVCIQIWSDGLKMRQTRDFFLSDLIWNILDLPTHEPKCIEYDLKKFRICPTWGQYDPLWVEIWSLWADQSHSQLSSQHRSVMKYRT